MLREALWLLDTEERSISCRSVELIAAVLWALWDQHAMHGKEIDFNFKTVGFMGEGLPFGT